jgi:hypothetical protein
VTSRSPQSHGTRRRSPGVSLAAFLAHPPDLQPWPSMDMDFAIGCPLVLPQLPRYPVAVRRVASSLHTSFRRFLAVPPLCFTRASPPSGCTGDFHPQAAGHAQHTAQPIRLARTALWLTDRPAHSARNWTEDFALGYFGSLTRGAVPSPTRAAGAAPTTMEEVAEAPNPTRAKALQRSQDQRSQDQRRRVAPQKSPG